jgi:hypothetical protein
MWHVWVRGKVHAVVGAEKQGKKLLGRRICKYNIELNLQGVGWGSVDWT